MRGELQRKVRTDFKLGHYPRTNWLATKRGTLMEQRVRIGLMVMATIEILIYL